MKISKLNAAKEGKLYFFKLENCTLNRIKSA